MTPWHPGTNDYYLCGTALHQQQQHQQGCLNAVVKGFGVQVAAGAQFETGQPQADDGPTAYALWCFAGVELRKITLFTWNYAAGLRKFLKEHAVGDTLAVSFLLLSNSKGKVAVAVAAGLKKFLKKHAVGDTLAVLDAKLGGLIKEKLEINCVHK
jgi:hypothetical protein